MSRIEFFWRKARLLAMAAAVWLAVYGHALAAKKPAPADDGRGRREHQGLGAALFHRAPGDRTGHARGLPQQPSLRAGKAQAVRRPRHLRQIVRRRIEHGDWLRADEKGRRCPLDVTGSVPVPLLSTGPRIRKRDRHRRPRRVVTRFDHLGGDRARLHFRRTRRHENGAFRHHRLGLMGREFASAAARWCHLTEMDVRPEIVAVCDANRESAAAGSRRTSRRSRRPRPTTANCWPTGRGRGRLLRRAAQPAPASSTATSSRPAST